ncbi:MAG: hypothetical protein K2I23_07360, partial [Clostridia bacterium]|nr:hypothetical protein [Clostridia bacterium]
VYFKPTATFGASGGEIRYSLDGGKTWMVYDESQEHLVVKKNGAKVRFNAVSNTYDHKETQPPYKMVPVNALWNQTVTVNVTLETVEITFNDITITGASKIFNGTDAFTGTVTLKDKDAFIAENGIDGDVTINSVKYASVNAGDEIALIIDVSCTDDTKIIDNKIEGAVGSIEKAEISIVIANAADKIYGVALPTFKYTQSGMITGQEEDITPYIYVVKPEGYDGTYEMLPTSAEGYVITVDTDTVLTNYVIKNVTEGKIKVTLAPIDRLVYEKGQFTGLDTKNIANRNLEIGFTRSNGAYEKLDVKFYEYGIRKDPNTGDVIEQGYIKEVADITKAPADFYRVKISLPKTDANGESLDDKYYIDDNLKDFNFMIKIIDASIFDKVEKEPAKKDPAKQESTQNVVTQEKQEAPVINNSASAQVGIYEDGYANADNTDMAIESTQKQKDYIAMISIFCAVAITIAFAIGVGKAIQKRIRR